MQIGVAQMTSGASVPANRQVAAQLVRRGAEGGARLVCLPEYALFHGDETEWMRVAREETPSFLADMAALADELSVYVSVGSVLEDVPDDGTCANTSVMLGPDGAEVACYRKRHLFDVDLPDRAVRESDWLIAGTTPVVCDVDGWRVGLSICFDVRFAEHYAALREMGAELILVPSAFTAETGRAHWRPLLRARAIETQCFVAAAAQTGLCAPGKPCHGHAMIVDPWGEVLADCGETEGIVFADLDRVRLDDVRARIPMR